MNAKDLVEMAEGVFAKKAPVNALHQELAENFYPERADFTFRRDPGDEFAAHLMTSYPVMVRREFGDQAGAMLRPAGQPWFRPAVSDPEREDHEARQWLEFAGRVQRRAMYDPVAMLERACKESDHDYVTFGQHVMSSEIIWNNRKEGPHLLHRCWHLRDMAWTEDRFGNVGNRFRRWKPSVRTLAGLFPGKVHASVESQAKLKPLTEIECMHLIVEADLFDMPEAQKRDKPWVSIYYDCQNRHVMEAVATHSPYYMIGRWQTVSGSQYAYSPATIIGLPDARLIQAMTRTLLEAGEKIANPPMVATDEVVRSDVAIYPGGLTWVDRDYDERLGQALRPLTTDAKGMPLGLDMLQDSKSVMAAVFFLNKLSLPQRGPEMTAYEVGQRIQQYIRDALPLFAPMEAERNGQLCEHDFDLLMRAGAFGSPRDMPRSLQNARFSFIFMSPLHDAIESQKTQKFLELSQLLAAAVQMDQQAGAIPDVTTAFRDAMAGAGIPAAWLRSPITVKQLQQQQAAQQQAEQVLDNMVIGSEAVKNLGAATQGAAALETGVL